MGAVIVVAVASAETVVVLTLATCAETESDNVAATNPKTANFILIGKINEREKEVEKRRKRGKNGDNKHFVCYTKCVLYVLQKFIGEQRKKTVCTRTLHGSSCTRARGRFPKLEEGNCITSVLLLHVRSFYSDSLKPMYSLLVCVCVRIIHKAAC